MPNLLEIFRDFVKPGREAEFRAIEEDAARICAEHAYPHVHIALQSLSSPREIWWLNEFDSIEERDLIGRQYESNPALVAAFEAIHERRKAVVDPPIDVIARYNPGLSRGKAWRFPAKFYVTSVTPNDPEIPGSVFDGPDGTHFVLCPVDTLEDAVLMGGDAGLVFALRPYWGMPAREWVAADREFWEASPIK
jgi:hypothetical protein